MGKTNRNVAEREWTVIAHKSTDVRVSSVAVYFLPLELRMPLKFGGEVVTHLTCARVRVMVEDRSGRRAEGWGETPLSAAWAWPAPLAYREREETMKAFCLLLAKSWTEVSETGHPIEIGYGFLEEVLPDLLKEFNAMPGRTQTMPWLAALIACSPFDIAVHDAYGNLLGRPVYATYGPEFMNRDLASVMKPAEGCQISFVNRYPKDFLISTPDRRLAVWHLVGGADPLKDEDRIGGEPDDGYPVTLADWIRRDGLRCLKIKLRGTDAAWDYERLIAVGSLGAACGVAWLSPDFNCTVTDPAYVTEILDRLRDEHPRLYGMILYVEQPFPYDLENHRIDVHSVSSRKPLFMDESAHDWRLIGLGRSLGWTGVALKTCKTQTGALLSLCWAKAHGMTLMVQDLTNPMLAIMPHVLLAAHAGTIMGVECNAMQYYPAASGREEAVHQGLYRRVDGCVDLASIGGTGFGYRFNEIKRQLPEPFITIE